MEFEKEIIVKPREKTLGEKIVQALAYIIYVFIAICFVTAILGKMYAKKIGSDNVKPFGILFFSLYTWDFYSDIMFCVRLSDAEQWTLFIVGMLFIFIPWIMNLVQLFQAQKKWTTDKSVQEGVRGWLIDWSIILVVAVIVSGNSFGAIELANVCWFFYDLLYIKYLEDAINIQSNLFGHDLFSMGLNPRHLKEFQAKRIYSSVVLENVPQLCIQIYFLTILGSFDEATFVALLSSSISVILSIVDIWSAKRLVSVMDQNKNDGLININTIEFIILSNDEIEFKKSILLTKPRALARAIAETLVLDSRNVEIYQLLASTHGIKVGFNVYAMSYDCDKMIDDLIDEKTKLQLLINNYWHLKQFPDVSEFHQGTMTNAQSGLLINGEAVEEEYSIGNNWNATTPKGNEINKLHANYAQFREQGMSVSSINSGHSKVSSMHHIPLNRMKTVMKNKMKALDPELLKHSKVNTYETDTEIEMIEMGENTMPNDDPAMDEEIGDGEEITNNYTAMNSPTDTFEIDFENSNGQHDFKHYMNNLQKYAVSQNEIYESHPISKEKPLELLEDHRNNTQNEQNENNDDALWIKYTENIKQLLEERKRLQQDEERDDGDLNEIWESMDYGESMGKSVDEMIVDKMDVGKIHIASISGLELSNVDKFINTPSVPSNESNDHTKLFME